MKGNLKKYNRYTIGTLCRVCLTQTTATMIPLETPLKEDDEKGPLVQQALEQVMCVKVNTVDKLPNKICPMCLGLLKISYDLKEQFTISQHALAVYYASTGENVESFLATGASEAVSQNLLPAKSQRSPVELVVGAKKYSINEVVIVEEDPKPKDEYDGFLKNLGTSVSASFVDKSYKYEKKDIQPSILLEKVIKQVETRRVKNIEPSTLDQYIIDRNKENEIEMKELNLREEDLNINLNDKDLNINLNNLGIKKEFDEDLIKSALNLQYKCTKCKKLFMSKTRLTKHQEMCLRIHSNVALICYICERKFKQKKHLTYHIKKDHLNMKLLNLPTTEKEKTREYVCPVCNRVCKSSGNLAYHKLKHTEKQYTCETCGKHFYTKNNLHVHQQVHEKQQTKVLCPICGKGFHYQSGLFYHMKLHTNERKYLCTFCDRKFYALNALKRHMRTHTGVRPYDCKYCDKKFFSLGEVKKHTYIHTGFRPDRCKYCDKGFTSKFNLKVHLLQHSGDHACHFCPKSFIDMDVLKFHIKNKHTVKEVAQIENDVYHLELGVQEESIDNNYEDQIENNDDQIDNNEEDQIDNNDEDQIELQESEDQDEVGNIEENGRIEVEVINEGEIMLDGFPF